MLRRLITYVIQLAITLTLSILNIYASDKPEILHGSGKKLDDFSEETEFMPSMTSTQTRYKFIGLSNIISNSPGVEIGWTTWDLQSYGMNSRMISGDNDGTIHFVFTKSASDSLDILLDTRVGYQIWDSDEGNFIFEPGNTCDVNVGSSSSYSRFPWLDIDSEGKAVIAAYQMGTTGTASTVWYDYSSGSCFFSPYKSRLPDSTMQYGCNAEDIVDGKWHFRWPSMSYQVFESDTITHMVAFQSQSAVQGRTQRCIHYFRRTGSDAMGSWDYPPMIVDTVSTLGAVVTSSRISGKSAIVWAANPGNYPGDPESIDRFNLYDINGREWTGRKNDIYYLMSNNMGLFWGQKINVTGYDSSVGGWLADANISAMIDSDDYLHIVWNAREVIPSDEIYCDFTTYYGSRIFHWDELTNEIRTVKDANWPLSDPYSLCLGGYYNYSWLTKPMISECDGKFYTVFVQYHDIPNGIDDDCAETRFTGGGNPSSTANGEIYLSVSDNGGYNWDIARNLTNTYTPHCYADESEGSPVCEADAYPSIPNFGMALNDSLDFYGVPIVDPSNGSYSGDYFLDLLYINDKYPGPWDFDLVYTNNPLKWFRLPCVDPVPNPVLAIETDSIGRGIWTKPGIQLDTTIRVENLGNTPLHISTMLIHELTGSGWLDIDNYGPLDISHLTPNYYDLTLYLNVGGAYNTSPHRFNGHIIINSDSEGGSVDSIFVDLIIADTLQLPEYADIKTECLQLKYGNTGNLGDGQGGLNLNFINDCDTTDNTPGENNNSAIYIFDGSPFIARIIENDTIIDYCMYNTDWISENGLRPLESTFNDTLLYTDYQYGSTNRFCTHDSSIILEEEFFAPTASDSCEFIVSKLTVFNSSESSTDSVYIGDFIDWDIPSDDNKNKSECNSSDNLFYIYGNETNYSATDNNNCVLSSERFGGYIFYGGYKLPYCTAVDSISKPRSLWSHMNAKYIYPTADFVQSEIFRMIDSIEGFIPWVASDSWHPDSVFVDLFMTAVYGKFTLMPTDTLVFVRILAAEYNSGISGLETTVAKAKEWINSRPDIFYWPSDYTGDCDCCDTPGDVNDDKTNNIFDITFLIAYLYKNGLEPPCLNEADVNESCDINIFDITYLISYLYKNGPEVKCGCLP